MAFAAEDVIGSWELVDWRAVPAGAPIYFPLGEQAQGRIIYTAAGTMAAVLMNPDWVTGNGGEMEGRFLAYSGRYWLDGDVVQHNVDLASMPWIVGLTLPRRLAWRGDQLFLTTIGPADGTTSSIPPYEVLWRRS